MRGGGVLPWVPPCPIAELRLCERGLERVHRLLLHEPGIICPRAAGRIPRRGSDDGDAHAHRLALTWRIGCDRKRTHREVGSSRTRNRDGVTRGVVVFTAFADQAERIDDGTETILARWSVRRDDRSGGVGRLLARTERSRPAYAPAAQKCSAAKLS